MNSQGVWRGLLRASVARCLVFVALLSATSAATAQQKEVALSGFAYSGDAGSIAQRFPYTKKYEAALKAAGDSPAKRIAQAVKQAPPQHLRLLPQIAELKGSDQALAVALVVNAETVSVEQFGELRKLLVLVKGQVLFFDFKSMSVARAYPISFASIDTFPYDPSEADVLARLTQVYEGAGGKPGLFARFANALAKATIPETAAQQLQVTQVSIKPEALEFIPAAVKSAPGSVETWAADMLAEALSTRAGVPIIPYAKGYAIGNVMSMSIADGDVFNLKLPKPDHEISLELSGFKKIKYGEAAAGVSYIYGAYAKLAIEEPLMGRKPFNSALKNGEVKLVPATQVYVDDFPAFYDSLNLMFVKLAQALDGQGNAWVKSAAAAPDIERQIEQTKELIKKCK
ncbi:hypothetical protein HNP55_004204 [Paucibacter oligotrophus]|uniref:Uncharacterized protein n=1 Tax=Roseateles oligotrophus TaxID=1769250 RepID=A0A840LGA2_9BURK|nr:hypothetical protein [Roseateles oligotrophus]MBB4845652.1 hypothetical protein [Roseateles oligotrophus]